MRRGMQSVPLTNGTSGRWKVSVLPAKCSVGFDVSGTMSGGSGVTVRELHAEPPLVLSFVPLNDVRVGSTQIVVGDYIRAVDDHPCNGACCSHL